MAFNEKGVTLRRTYKPEFSVRKKETSYPIKLCALGLVPILLSLQPQQQNVQTHIQQSQSTHSDTMYIAVSAGWNLISLPLVVPDARKTILFPTAISDAFAYKHGYVVQDTLQPDIGCWLKFRTPDTVAVIGNSNFIPETRVNPRWNIIGSSSVKTAVVDIVVDTSVLFVSKVYGYSRASGYSVADTIEPGKGYWVKCRSAGNITLATAGPQGPVLVSPANGSIDQPTSTVLRWDAVPVAATYHLQIASDSSFAELLLVDDSLVVDTTWKLCLGYGASCYWRVAVRYGGGFLSGWSSAWRFTTGVAVNSLRWEFLGFPNGGETGVMCIGVSPANDSIVFVGTSSNFSAGTQGRVYRTTNLGASWDTVLTGVTPMCIRFNPQNPEIVFVGLSITNFTPPGIIKTTDGGNTWFWSNHGISVNWETGVSDIEIDQHYPDTMFAGTGGVYGGGIYKTTNGGNNWFTPTANDSLARTNIQRIAIHPDTSSIVFAATSFSGWLFRSSNGGMDWELTGLDSERSNIYAIAIDPVDPQVMYATVKDNWGKLKKSTDGGWTWLTSSNGLLGSTGGTLLIRNCTSEVFLGSSYGFYESSDFGAQWGELASPSNGNLIAVATLSADGSYLYVALSNSGIYRARLISGNSN